MKIGSKSITRLYDAPDAGIKVIIGMHANLHNAIYAVIPFILIQDVVPIKKITLNLLLDGFIHHFVNRLMTRRIWYRKCLQPWRKIPN
jgi:hypothetical protein